MNQQIPPAEVVQQPQAQFQTLQANPAMNMIGSTSGNADNSSSLPKVTMGNIQMPYSIPSINLNPQQINSQPVTTNVSPSQTNLQTQMATLQQKLPFSTNTMQSMQPATQLYVPASSAISNPQPVSMNTNVSNTYNMNDPSMDPTIQQFAQVIASLTGMAQNMGSMNPTNTSNLYATAECRTTRGPGICKPTSDCLATIHMQQC